MSYYTALDVCNLLNSVQPDSPLTPDAQSIISIVGKFLVWMCALLTLFSALSHSYIQMPLITGFSPGPIKLLEFLISSIYISSVDRKLCFMAGPTSASCSTQIRLSPKPNGMRSWLRGDPSLAPPAAYSWEDLTLSWPQLRPRLAKVQPNSPTDPIFRVSSWNITMSSYIFGTTFSPKPQF